MKNTNKCQEFKTDAKNPKKKNSTNKCQKFRKQEIKCRD